MKNSIIALKIKYKTSDKDKTTILSYIKNYNNVLRFTYNRIKDGITTKKELSLKQKDMNNIFIGSYLKCSAIFDAKELAEKDKVIFGGKKLFLLRNKNKISSDDYKLLKLRPLYSVGEANQNANRLFKIIDENTILFKPNKKVHINLKLINSGKNYKKKLNKLISLQNNKEIAITYRLDLDYIYISFDNSMIESSTYSVISNRVFAIDMNPNYLGYSIIDRDENKYKIISSGVIDISEINKKDNSLRVSSSDKKKQKINNKRKFELFQICHYLAKLCKHFQCGFFAIEELSIIHKDNGKGRKFNKLINNQWNLTAFVNCLSKLINSTSTTLIKTKPEYSSIIGNLVYRNEKLPDMVLSSIEISRRGYEFASQYLLNIKSKQKNVIFPNFDLVKERVKQSLEELNHPFQFQNYQELFSGLKKSKIRYRFLLKDVPSFRVSSLFYIKSFIKLYNF